MKGLNKDLLAELYPLLDRALELSPSERAAWLDRLRTERPAVTPWLESLLEQEAALDTSGLLEGEAWAQLIDDAAPAAGLSVGAYTLERPLGRGGMGSAWLARRGDGRYEGTVAVKLLNLALLDPVSSERFRREGTVLARLTHPNIAHLVDAGLTDGGQPFLVLEYVEGRHIDEYCDEHRLTPARRLALFLQVLAAVGHAHTNLIVHRDLKPSNILVTADGSVKLLDFGIAKLLDDGAPEEGSLTERGGLALTPEYAAPEQASGGPVTTATDVYALGVLLYVLLAGRHPTGQRCRTAAEHLRAVLDTEPPRLSAAVAGSGSSSRAGPARLAAVRATTAKRLDFGHPNDAAALIATAARRATTPDKLCRSLRGDLETIVAKALKKRPQDRYPTVLALAGDLERYLDHQPISARPDTFAYRAAKFVGRHRRGVATAFAIVLLVATFVGFYTVRLAAERDRARLEAEKAATISAFLSELFIGADPYATRDTREPTVRELLDIGAARARRELAGEPALLAEMLTVIGRVYQRLGLNDRAQPLLEQALALGRSLPGSETVRVAQTLNDLGVLLRMKGDHAAATALLEEAVRMRQRLLGPEDKDVAVSLVELGRVYDDRGLLDRAEPVFRQALAIRRRALGDAHRETATSASDLGLLLRQKGDLAGAEALLREALDISRQALGDDHPNVATSLNNLGLIFADQGDHTGAEALYRKALAINRQVLGPRHRSVATNLNNLAHPLRESGQYQEAAAALEEALEIVDPTLGRDHPIAATFTTNLGRTRLAQGDAAAAETLLHQALQVRQRVYPEGDWRIGVTKSLLGASLTALGRHDEAERLLLDAKTILKDIPGPQGREAEATRARLVALYESWGRPDEAHRALTPRR